MPKEGKSYLTWYLTYLLLFSCDHPKQSSIHSIKQSGAVCIWVDLLGEGKGDRSFSRTEEIESLSGTVI